MSLNPEKVKKSILKAISANPSEIEFKQTIKNLIEGHFEESEITSKLTVLIYEVSNKTELKTSSDTIGTSYSSKRYSMIADYAANLEVTPQSAIEFDCKEGHMKMANVYPIVIKDTICGYEVDLERID